MASGRASRMKVAAYQAPLLPAGSMEAIELIRERIRWCEAEGVQLLCCPEAILGGLADYSDTPDEFAIETAELESRLAPLASAAVTTVVGFTERAGGSLYNSAAVMQRGSTAGVYRKLHPAIHRSVYAAGTGISVFRAGELTFGILICNDSNYPELARLIAARGATVLLVPTNNGLPAAKASAKLVAETRKVDIARATENSLWVVRADVAGRTDQLVSRGSSGIVDPNGVVVRTARELSADLLVADVPAPKARASTDA